MAQAPLSAMRAQTIASFFLLINRDVYTFFDRLKTKYIVRSCMQ